jgi:hypothetical protein
MSADSDSQSAVPPPAPVPPPPLPLPDHGDIEYRGVPDDDSDGCTDQPEVDGEDDVPPTSE